MPTETIELPVLQDTAQRICGESATLRNWIDARTIRKGFIDAFGEVACSLDAHRVDTEAGEPNSGMTPSQAARLNKLREGYYHRLQKRIEQNPEGDLSAAEKAFAIGNVRATHTSNRDRKHPQPNCFKSIESIALKLAQGVEEASMKDTVRMTFSLPQKPENFICILENFIQEMEAAGLTLNTDFLAKFRKTKPTGYSDTTLFFYTSGGKSIEVQINTESMIKAKYEDEASRFYLTLKEIAAKFSKDVEEMRHFFTPVVKDHRFNPDLDFHTFLEILKSLETGDENKNSAYSFFLKIAEDFCSEPSEPEIDVLRNRLEALLNFQTGQKDTEADTQSENTKSQAETIFNNDIRVFLSTLSLQTKVFEGAENLVDCDPGVIKFLVEKSNSLNSLTEVESGLALLEMLKDGNRVNVNSGGLYYNSYIIFCTLLKNLNIDPSIVFTFDKDGLVKINENQTALTNHIKSFCDRYNQSELCNA